MSNESNKTRLAWGATGPEKPKDRVRAVERLIAKGQSSREIAVLLAPKFSVAESTIYDDCRFVWSRLAEEDVEEKPVRKNQMRSTMRRLFATCLKNKDFKTAVQVLDRLAKLDGLYAPERVDVQHLPESEFQAELRDLVREQLRGMSDDEIAAMRGGN